MPADLAAALPASDLADALRKIGVGKIGQRQRVLALLHQRAAASAANPLAKHTAVASAAWSAAPLESTAAASPPPSSPCAIPRRLFTFWHADPNAPRARAAADEELVRCCLARMRLANPTWEVRVLTPACDDLPPTPVPVESLTGAQLADWYRLAGLSAYGGVYLDATCICLQSLESWVDVSTCAVQGFTLVSDLTTMESWAIAAPAASAFLAAWRDEFAKALRTGTKAYCASLHGSVISRGLRPSLPYLAIHAAWCVVRAAMPDAPFLLHSPVEAGRPYRFLAERNWESADAVSSLFAKTAEELAVTPLIKLRGKERDSVVALATYGRASGLARALLGSTVPATVTERLAFVRVGLDPDGEPGQR